MMTEEQFGIVENSWKRVRGYESELVTNFYEDLFQRDKRYYSMFSHNMSQQRVKFLNMLTTIIHGIRHLEKLKSLLFTLGETHDHLEIKKEDYTNAFHALATAFDAVL